jgi:hypothetical protein
LENGVDDLNLEELQPLENAEQKEVPAQTTTPDSPEVPVAQPAPVTPQWNLRRLIIPGGIGLAILLVTGLYLLLAPAPNKLLAQVSRFDVALKPNMTKVVMSITNKDEKPATIFHLYPVFFGKEHSGIYTRTIEGAKIEGGSLPLILNPSEERTINIIFSIEKKDLDQFADVIKDSSHIVVSQNGTPGGQLEGFLGLSWKVVDADGKEYSNTEHLAYYVLMPTPSGFKDPTALTRSWTLSDEPFELCSHENVVKESE